MILSNLFCTQLSKYLNRLTTRTSQNKCWRNDHRRDDATSVCRVIKWKSSYLRPSLRLILDLEQRIHVHGTHNPCTLLLVHPIIQWQRRQKITTHAFLNTEDSVTLWTICMLYTSSVNAMKNERSSMIYEFDAVSKYQAYDFGVATIPYSPALYTW